MPRTLIHRPTYLPLVPLAAVVATLLEFSTFNAAPAIGLPRVDLPTLVGSVFTADLGGAMAVGYILYFLIDVLLAPLPVWIAWPRIPGPPESFRGALLRGLIWGAVYGVLAGLLGLRFGPAGALVAFVANLLWGIAFALIAAMARGISPLDTLGWDGYDMAMGQHDIGRSLETHTPGRWG